MLELFPALVEIIAGSPELHSDSLTCDLILKSSINRFVVWSKLVSVDVTIVIEKLSTAWQLETIFESTKYVES